MSGSVANKFGADILRNFAGVTNLNGHLFGADIIRDFAGVPNQKNHCCPGPWLCNGQSVRDGYPSGFRRVTVVPVETTKKPNQSWVARVRINRPSFNFGFAHITWAGRVTFRCLWHGFSNLLVGLSSPHPGGKASLGPPGR